MLSFTFNSSVNVEAKNLKKSLILFRLHVRIMKPDILLVSGSPCPDDGTSWEDAPEGEYILHYLCFSS